MLNDDDDDDDDALTGFKSNQTAISLQPAKVVQNGRFGNFWFRNIGFHMNIWCGSEIQFGNPVRKFGSENLVGRLQEASHRSPRLACSLCPAEVPLGSSSSHGRGRWH